MIDLYLYLIAGMLVYVLINLSSFNKQTPTLDKTDTINEYFIINKWNLLAGLLFGIVLISFLSIGKFSFLRLIGVNIMSNPESAFLIGIINQWLLKSVRLILFKAEIYQTNLKKVKQING